MKKFTASKISYFIFRFLPKISTFSICFFRHKNKKKSFSFDLYFQICTDAALLNHVYTRLENPTSIFHTRALRHKNAGCNHLIFIISFKYTSHHGLSVLQPRNFSRCHSYLLTSVGVPSATALLQHGIQFLLPLKFFLLYSFKHHLKSHLIAQLINSPATWRLPAPPTGTKCGNLEWFWTISTGRRNLRSATHGDLLVPRTRTLTDEPRSFAVSVPCVWTDLPPTLRASLGWHTQTASKHTEDNTVLFSLRHDLALSWLFRDH